MDVVLYCNKFTLEHALLCKVGGLDSFVIQRTSRRDQNQEHDTATCPACMALKPSAASQFEPNKPLISTDFGSLPTLQIVEHQTKQNKTKQNRQLFGLIPPTRQSGTRRQTFWLARSLWKNEWQ